MKKLVGISSFCNDDKKIKVLKSNLSKLQSLGVDTLLYTPLTLPQEIYDLCTHVILTSENPILKWPERSMIFWKTLGFKNNDIKLNIFSEDYGWASLNQMKRLAQYASNLDYKGFHLMIYDLDITPEIEFEIKNNFTPTLYKQRGPVSKRVRPMGGLFSTWDKTSLKVLSDSLSLSSYKNYHSAENYLEVLNKSLLNLKISPIITEDLIHFDKDINEDYNMSHSNSLSLFINTLNNLKIYFYDINKPTNVKIEVNGIQYLEYLESSKYLDINIPINDITSLSIEVEGKTEDYIKYLPKNTNVYYKIEIKK